MFLCIYAPLYSIVHSKCVWKLHFCAATIITCTRCIHSSIQSVNRFLVRFSFDWFDFVWMYSANTVTSHCGWHALFWLTLLSFDCNFIQKIRISILAQWLCMCEFVVQFMCIIYIFGFLITCRGNLLLFRTIVHFLCFRLRFGFYISFWYTLFYLLFSIQLPSNLQRWMWLQLL